MNIAMTFESIEAYQRAKGATVDNLEPTNEIMELLYPSEVTASTPGTVTVVSTIAGYGTVVDSINLIVKDGQEERGDVLLDKNGTKYWLKSMLVLSGEEMLSLGGVYYNSATFPTGYTQLGVLVEEQGDEMLLKSMDDIVTIYQAPDVVEEPTGNPSSKGYYEYDSSTDVYTASSDTSVKSGKTYYAFPDVIPNVTSSGYVTNGATSSLTNCSDSLMIAERYQNGGYARYSYPFPRTAWDDMMAKIKANEAGGYTDSSTTWYWSVTKSSDGTGLGVGSFTCRFNSATTTYNPATYDYSFETWYNKFFLVCWSSYRYADNDYKGLQNTKALVAWAGVDASTKVPAAYWCNQKSINVDGFGQGNWYLPALGQLLKIAKYYPIFYKKGTTPKKNQHYTSTQSTDSTKAWTCSFNSGRVYAADRCTLTASHVCAFINYHR